MWRDNCGLTKLIKIPPSGGLWAKPELDPWPSDISGLCNAYMKKRRAVINYEIYFQNIILVAEKPICVLNTTISIRHFMGGTQISASDGEVRDGSHIRFGGREGYS